jgi:pimeloyl-ACP methyl ester carboxylesterase
MSLRLGKRILLPCLILSMLLLAAASAVFAHLNLHLPRRPLPPLEAAQKSYPQASWRDASLTTTDGVTLRAWYGTPPNPSSRCVVILHGIIDNRSGPMGLAPMFLNAQYTVLLPDTRGHGVSGGELSTYGLYEKVRRSYCRRPRRNPSSAR